MRQSGGNCYSPYKGIAEYTLSLFSLITLQLFRPTPIRFQVATSWPTSTLNSALKEQLIWLSPTQQLFRSYTGELDPNRAMGLKGSKPKLSKEDLEFLKKNTNFTEEQIKEWYKGFVVSDFMYNGDPNEFLQDSFQYFADR